MPDTIDRTQPPPKYFTPSGFQNATNGPPNTYAAIGSNHTRAHFDSRGWIDQIGEPTSSTGIPGSAMVPYDPWDPNNQRAANQPPPVYVPPSVVTPPPPTPTPPVTPAPPGTLPPGTPPPIVGPPVMGSDLRLLNGAFNVSCRYDARDRNLDAGPALARKYSEQSGVFTFFSPDNWEVVVKYAVGRFFIAALTDVAFALTMKHLASGEVRTFTNTSGDLLCETVPFA